MDGCTCISLIQTKLATLKLKFECSRKDLYIPDRFDVSPSFFLMQVI